MVENELIGLVKRLAAAGRTEPEMIGQLRAAGFKPAEIDAALKAVLKEMVAAGAAEAVRQVKKVLPSPPAVLAPKPPPEIAPKKPEDVSFPEISAIPEELRPIQIPGEPPPRRPGLAQSYEPGAKGMAAKSGELERGEQLKEGKPLGNQGSPGARPPFTEQPQQAARTPFAEPSQPAAPPSFRPMRAGPEVTAEELIEEVVAENMRKLELRLALIDKRDAELASQLVEAKQMMEEAKKIDSKMKIALDAHTEEFKEFLEKFETRLSALEKAFKALAGHSH